MKINRSETHDRLLELKKQSDYIAQGCEDCIKNRPAEFGTHPFYIFAHKRTIDLDERRQLLTHYTYYGYKSVREVPTHRMIWLPRLTKPRAQSNSMLFKYYPQRDVIKIIWIIPEEEIWKESSQGNMLESDIVQKSIHLFKHEKNVLEDKEDDDMDEQKVYNIYKEIQRNARRKKSRESR